MAKDYEVGYGKPPVKTRFRKGRSGNPKGRPKGVRNLKTDYLEEMNEHVTVSDGSGATTITKRKTVIKVLFAQAAKGDMKAIALLLQLALRLEEIGPDEVLQPELSAKDKQILKRIQDRHRTPVMEDKEDE